MLQAMFLIHGQPTFFNCVDLIISRLGQNIKNPLELKGSNGFSAF